MPTTAAVGVAKKPPRLTRSAARGRVVGSSAAPLAQCPGVQQPGRMPLSPQFGQHFFPAPRPFMAGPEERMAWDAGAGRPAWTEACMAAGMADAMGTPRWAEAGTASRDTPRVSARTTTAWIALAARRIGSSAPLVPQ
ncbi:hypothetical protein CR162_15250 [Pseudoroseomonas rhizosphaerae]|uniref:Uncharacterized protein n=1 Tax=Teichococcus rhizosphaerae TaxID=1335062 RepID=A0A2C7A235_9PROT|nr:hypothetical protein CR162_15250 [Pseudoroseomonas rhizosphaerae]